MSEETGTADVQDPQLDDFDRTLGGTPDGGTESVGTPAPSDTSDFDYDTFNIENGDINSLPESARGAASAFQRRAREMSAGVKSKVGEVNTYESELLEARERIQELERAPSQTAIPGQNVSEVAQAMGVDSTNSTPQSLQSLNTVVDVIDNHPLAKQVQALTSEIQALKEQTGTATDFVEAQHSNAYNTEYATAVENHGADITNRVIETYGDMRGRPGLNGQPLTVDSLVAQMTGKAAADAASIDEQASSARADARTTAGGMVVTSGLSPDNNGTPTDAEETAFYEKHFN